jgi:DNA modification methylase
MFRNASISKKFSPSERIVVYPGDCLDLLKGVPDGSFQLIVTSPPYNIGKEYEKKLNLNKKPHGDVVCLSTSKSTRNQRPCQNVINVCEQPADFITMD